MVDIRSFLEEAQQEILIWDSFRTSLSLINSTKLVALNFLFL